MCKKIYIYGLQLYIKFQGAEGKDVFLIWGRKIEINWTGDIFMFKIDIFVFTLISLIPNGIILQALIRRITVLNKEAFVGANKKIILQIIFFLGTDPMSVRKK